MVAGRGLVDCDPEVVWAPVQPPDALQELTFAEDHSSVAAVPAVAVVGVTLSLTEGASPAGVMLEALPVVSFDDVEEVPLLVELTLEVPAEPLPVPLEVPVETPAPVVAVVPKLKSDDWPQPANSTAITTPITGKGQCAPNVCIEELQEQ